MQRARLDRTLLLILVMLATLNSTLALVTHQITVQNQGQIAVPKITVASGYARDIQLGVDWVVAHGGVGDVYIPEGNFSFVNVGEWITVNVPAGVNIFGAPTERDANGQVVQWKTTLAMPYDVPGNSSSMPTWFTINGNGDPGRASRFSDLKLSGYRETHPNSIYMSYGIEIWSVVDFRIDHCYFRDICAGLWIGGAKGVPSRGLIDHCKLVNTNGVAGPNIDDATVGYGIGIGRTNEEMWDPNILNVVGHYTNYTCVIEDCYFEKWRHCIAGSPAGGMHYILRHCTINNDFGFGSLDAHGSFANAQFPNVVGTRAAEIYNNTLTNCQDGWGKTIMYWRGGGGCFYANTNDGTYLYIQVIWESHTTIYPGWDKSKTHDVWIWGNNADFMVSTPSGQPPTPGVDFFVNQGPMPGYVNNVPYPHPLTLRTTT